MMYIWIISSLMQKSSGDEKSALLLCVWKPAFVNSSGNYVHMCKQLFLCDVITKVQHYYSRTNEFQSVFHVNPTLRCILDMSNFGCHFLGQSLLLSTTIPNDIYVFTCIYLYYLETQSQSQWIFGKISQMYVIQYEFYMMCSQKFGCNLYHYIIRMQLKHYMSCYSSC